MKFIDLFAGLGGFHLALKQMGHECVFACEIDEELRDLYETNFGIRPEGDIRNVDINKIPTHDILCAGFPCQPFSKAGPQNGFDYPEQGDLYQHILKIIEAKKPEKPEYLLLENVPNLQKHDDGKTWRHIETLLIKEGYSVRINKLSPHKFGIPQIRERIYIVAKQGEDSLLKYKEPISTNEGHKNTTIDDYLEKNPINARMIPKPVDDCLNVWQEFLNKISKDEKIPHPIWSMEFGATYPYQKTTPFKMSLESLKRYKGSFGISLNKLGDKEQIFKYLPSHARREDEKFPDWKQNYIKLNREFYNRKKAWLDEWIKKIQLYPPSFQKLEWNCQGETDRDIRDYIIQMRPSGVRVKRRTTAPSLVAMTSTQVPIIAREGRYITPIECAKLQSMDGEQGLKKLPESDHKAYEALGNAVNVKVAKIVASSLLNV